LQHDAMHNMTM